MNSGPLLTSPAMVRGVGVECDGLGDYERERDQRPWMEVCGADGPLDEHDGELELDREALRGRVSALAC